ncbi:MAG: hypothetical protein IT435_19215 [Phycisphaerales bacterium]|nr:hypothetical protein [Phycisphaerales bacterium]
MAAKALGIAPGDAGLIFLTAGNLASLGLRTLATEHVERLPEEAQRDADIVRLRSIIERLPADRLTAAQRIGSTRANLDALRGRAPALASRLAEQMAGWVPTVEGMDCFRAIDGNIVRRPGSAAGLSGCLSLVDQKGQSREFAIGAMPASQLMGRPVVIEGLCPPWVFMELMRATASDFNGYRRRMVLVQSDMHELLDGMSLADLRSWLADERLDIYAGPDSSRELARNFGGRLDTVLVGQYVPVLATRTRTQPPLETVLGELEQAQRIEHQALTERLEKVYEGRDAAWWGRRFASCEPLRVLIPTCRFSTFVRYSSLDLARAFEEVGHQARILMEPDDHSCMSSIAYLRQIAEFEPDLIVLINYPRAAMGQNFPRNVPFVCWVQDAMPHLFDAKFGAAQGELDFIAGVRLPELVGRFGYVARRAMPMPVVVSGSKFSGGPARSSKTGIVISYATHHGETPEAMHERLMKDAGNDPVLPKAMELLRPLAIRLGEDILATDQKKLIRSAVVDAIRQAAGTEAPQRVISVLTHSYIIPLADRIVRHTVASWAAELAERRGWILHLHGKNWEKHPTLAKYAAGPLDHGDSLRDSYRDSTVHLHASYHGPFHQRVFECALAGGLPICRLTWPAVSPLMAHAKRLLRERLGDRFLASASKGESGMANLRVADHPELRRVSDVLRAMDLPSLGAWGMEDLCPVPVEAPPINEVDDRSASLVEPMLACSFRNQAELEALIERAGSDEQWRERQSRGIAGTVRETLTHTAFAKSLIGFVGERLVPRSTVGRP